MQAASQTINPEFGTRVGRNFGGEKAGGKRGGTERETGLSAVG